MLEEQLRSVVEKLNLLTTNVMEHRCRVHSMLLGLSDYQSNGIPTTVIQTTATASKRQLNPVGAANPNSVSGGGHNNRPKLMTRSVTASPVTKVNANHERVMAKSLNSPLNRTSPHIAKLMEESMMIKSQYVV